MSAYDDFEDFYFSRLVPDFISNNVRKTMNKDATIVIRGIVHWNRLLGTARPYTGNPKYNKGPYWSVDITPDAKSMEMIKKVGIQKKLRDPSESTSEKETRKDKFLTLKVLENKADGSKNKPPIIKDVQGNIWPDDKNIGNGSVADVMVKVKDYGEGIQKGMYFQKMRVLSLVELESQDFEELSEDDEYFATGGIEDEDQAPPTGKPLFDSDLDDDVPF